MSQNAPQTPSLNPVVLRKLRNLARTETGRKIFEIQAARQRASRYTNLGGLRHTMKTVHGFELNRKQFDLTWMHLEALGLGKVLQSRAGAPTHFDWQGWDPASVGATALGQAAGPVKAHFRARPIKEKKSHKMTSPAMIVHDAVDQRKGASLRSVPAEAVFGRISQAAIQLEIKGALTASQIEHARRLLRQAPKIS